MPRMCEVPQKTKMYAVGNGRINTHSDISKQVLFATLETVPLHVCWRKYVMLFLRKSIVCAMDKSNYQSICDGDSGGPITKLDGTLIGVIAATSAGSVFTLDAFKICMPINFLFQF